jgi:predicted nuclease of restriction endonuclease-like (RecB) superfamily
MALKQTKLANPNDALQTTSTILIEDVRRLIREARQKAAAIVNADLTMLYWRIGTRIRNEALGGGRAAYGQQIVVSLIRQLSWTHFIALLPLKEALQRDFYAELCRAEGWTVRMLRQKIDSMLFERTALSRKPAKLARKELDALRNEDQWTPDMVFRDPYVLDFLKLSDSYSERDLEVAILRDIESFLLEMGGGFSFVSRQKRMVIDGEDHNLDLLFYHRRLRCLVAVELKLGKFKATYKGQMELYLRWLEENEYEAGEGSPLGLILCAEGGQESIALLRLDQAGIRVGQYLTELPPRKVLERKLHESIASSRARLQGRDEIKKERKHNPTRS